jgi:hypothetical protein
MCLSYTMDGNREWNSLILNFYASYQGFFFQFCDVAQLAIISKVILPNLATCTNMEVGKNQNLSVCLATYWN